VNYNRLDSDPAQVGHVFGKGALQLFVDHRVATELNYDHLAVKSL
jgi:hypothetical protein